MAERRRPHVLIIMSDQQRADCAGYAGHPLLRTPAMDRIAGEGTNFTHAMTPAPLCMPARASFSTGTYPHNHSTWANRGLLRRDLPTLFNCFGDAGYDTALIGKAHLFAQSEINVRWSRKTGQEVKVCIPGHEEGQRDGDDTASIHRGVQSQGGDGGVAR